jgi:hypothetical protein
MVLLLQESSISVSFYDCPSEIRAKSLDLLDDDDGACSEAGTGTHLYYTVIACVYWGFGKIKNG